MKVLHFFDIEQVKGVESIRPVKSSLGGWYSDVATKKDLEKLGVEFESKDIADVLIVPEKFDQCEVCGNPFPFESLGDVGICGGCLEKHPG